MTVRRTIARIRWRTVALAAAAILVVVILGLGLAATRRPAWYQPAPVDQTRLRDDKRDLVGLLDGIGAALNERRGIGFRLDEAQVNRWLAARAEMWPDSAIDLGPLRDPQISFQGDRIRAAALIENGDLRAVVSLTCRVQVSDERVVIEWESARLGALPVPRSWLSRWITSAGSGGRVVRQADGRGTVAFENDWIWPNGKRRYRLSTLRITDGAADVSLEPLPGSRW